MRYSYCRRSRLSLRMRRDDDPPAHAGLQKAYKGVFGSVEPCSYSNVLAAVWQAFRFCIRRGLYLRRTPYDDENINVDYHLASSHLTSRLLMPALWAAWALAWVAVHWWAWRG